MNRRNRDGPSRLCASLVASSIAISTVIAGPQQETPEDSAVRLARLTLARHLRVVDHQSEVVSVNEMTWPSSALGCPRKGQTYTQVIITGHKVTLRAGAIEYEIHLGAGRAVVCRETKTAFKPPINDAL